MEILAQFRGQMVEELRKHYLYESKRISLLSNGCFLKEVYRDVQRQFHGDG
jgi:hypothetical protein